MIQVSLILAVDFMILGSSPNDKSGNKLASLEGLRGLASFTVLINHISLAYLNNTFQAWSEPLKSHHRFIGILVSALAQPWVNGAVAVWTFWVISGFVLSLGYLKRCQQETTQEAQMGLVEAALRRYPRFLAPVFLSVMMAYALVANGMMHNMQLCHLFGETTNGQWLGLYYIFSPSLALAIKGALWDSFFSFNYDTTYDAVLWTIEREMYGSIFLFLFLFLFKGKRGRSFGYFICGASIFFLKENWLNCFVIGILLCDLYIHEKDILTSCPIWLSQKIEELRRSRFFGLTGTILIILLIGFNANELGSKLNGLMASFVVAWVLFCFPLQQIFQMPCLLFLGRISFGLYLVHLPIICSFSCWFYLVTYKVLGHVGTILIGSILTIFLSLMTGYLMYRYVDKPGMDAARQLTTRVSALWIKNRPQAKY